MSNRFQDLGKRGVLQFIDPALIMETPGWNVRIESDLLDADDLQLMNSIRSEGVKEPLTCYMGPDGPVLTNGHRRLRMVRLLIAEGMEIPLVPMRTENKESNDADRVLSMITRNMGKPLAPIETAQVLKRLAAFHWSIKDIATKTGFTPSYVSQLLKLGAAPAEVQAMISKGEVSASLASKVMRDEGPKATETIRAAVTKAKDDGKRKATPRAMAPSPEVSWSKVGPQLRKLAQGVLDHEAGSMVRLALFMFTMFPED